MNLDLPHTPRKRNHWASWLGQYTIHGNICLNIASKDISVSSKSIKTNLFIISLAYNLIDLKTWIYKVTLSANRSELWRYNLAITTENSVQGICENKMSHPRGFWSTKTS